MLLALAALCVAAFQGGAVTLPGALYLQDAEEVIARHTVSSTDDLLANLRAAAEVLGCDLSYRPAGPRAGAPRRWRLIIREHGR